MAIPPFFSVITVSYNSARTIGHTLESLRQQNFTDFESIVIDGGSTDNTMQIIDSYADVVTKSISEKDKGIYDAMNKGVDLARGQYIAFLNSDDVYFSDTLASVHAFAAELNPQIIYGDIEKIRVFDNETLCRTEKPDLSRMLETMGIFHPATFVKRSVFEQLGHFDLRFTLAADYHFLLRAYLAKMDFQYLEKTLVRFSIGGVSNFSCKSYEECVEILEELQTGYAPKMRELYKKCRSKQLRHRIIAKFVSLPIARKIYLNKIKKRWN